MLTTRHTLATHLLKHSHHNHRMFLSDEECEHSMWRVGTTTSTPASDNIKSCRKIAVQKHVYSCANILHTFTGFFATGTVKNSIKSSLSSNVQHVIMKRFENCIFSFSRKCKKLVKLRSSVSSVSLL